MNIKLPHAAINDARAVRARGGKVFACRPFLPPPLLDSERPPDTCQNCNGVGYVGLDIITGGPYDTPDNAKQHFTWIDGKYFKHEIKEYTCPVCLGHKANRQVLQQKEISL